MAGGENDSRDPHFLERALQRSAQAQQQSAELDKTIHKIVSKLCF